MATICSKRMPCRDIFVSAAEAWSAGTEKKKPVSPSETSVSLGSANSSGTNKLDTKRLELFSGMHNEKLWGLYSKTNDTCR